MTDYDLYKALNTVMQDAIKQCQKCDEMLEKPPLQGWSDEKHKAYWVREGDIAHNGYRYCHLRLMQLDPD